MNRLKELRKQKKMTQKDIAGIAGVSCSAVSLWESGRNNIDWKVAIQLAKHLGVTPEYLTGETNVIDTNSNDYEQLGFRIPIIGTIRAGIPVAAIEEIEDWEEIPASMARSGEYVALRIKGDSMEPKMSEGDIAIIRRQETIESGQIAAVLVNGDEATIKKVKILDDGIMLVAFNQDVYEPHYYSRKEVEELPIRIYGKLVELRCKF